MTISVRRLKLEDIDQVTSIIAKAFDSTRLGVDVAHQLDVYAKSEEGKLLITDQKDASVPSEYWVTESSNNGQIVAISGIYRFCWTSKAMFWLGWFAVSPNCQRSGIGSKVINLMMAIAKARGAASFKVETSRNGTAVSFYEKRGFKVEAVLSQYYSETTDAVVLTKSLLDMQPAPIQNEYKIDD